MRITWLLLIAACGKNSADAIAELRKLPTKEVTVGLSKINSSYRLTLPEPFVVGGSAGLLKPGGPVPDDACVDDSTLCATTWHQNSLFIPNFTIQVRSRHPTAGEDGWTCTADGADCSLVEHRNDLGDADSVKRAIRAGDSSVFCIADLHSRGRNPAGVEYLRSVCASLKVEPR